MWSMFGIYYVGNLIAQNLMNTGAFEISYNGQMVWSKLESGRLPSWPELMAKMQSADSLAGGERAFQTCAVLRSGTACPLPRFALQPLLTALWGRGGGEGGEAETARARERRGKRKRQRCRRGLTDALLSPSFFAPPTVRACVCGCGLQPPPHGSPAPLGHGAKRDVGALPRRFPSHFAEVAVVALCGIQRSVQRAAHGVL